MIIIIIIIIIIITITMIKNIDNYKSNQQKLKRPPIFSLGVIITTMKLKRRQGN